MTSLTPGSLFRDRYQIVRRLGEGGMGVVYLARDVAHPEFNVALKVVHPGLLDSSAARERFRTEIVAAFKINHPHIIQAYEYFDGGQLQAYSMEYVSGGDLLQRRAREPIGPLAAAHYLRQIAAALGAIHAAGIVHRDLKPENILLTDNNEVKVADFGVARVQGTRTVTQAGGLVGTPKYVAPEYIETGESDHRGDIFALGVIGYELIAGTSPFPASPPEALMARRGGISIPPLRHLAPHCPVELALIVERAMSLSLARRFQTADELRRALERFELDGSGPPEVSFESPTGPLPFTRPPPVPLQTVALPRRVAAGSALGLLCALGVVMARPRLAPLPEPAAMPPPASIASVADPRALGTALLEVATLEATLRERLALAPGAAILGAPPIEDARGHIIAAAIDQRVAWLKRALDGGGPPAASYSTGDLTPVSP